MSHTIAVPNGITAATAAAATKASEAIAATLAAAGNASAAAITAAYGADVTPAAVRLAKRAADELSGAAKSRGGARADVLAVRDAIADTLSTQSGVKLTDALLVAAASNRLAALAAAKRERTERKQQLAATLKDSGATLAARTAALEVLAGMDDADRDAAVLAATSRFDAALAAAVASGVPLDHIYESVAKLHNAPITVAA